MESDTSGDCLPDAYPPKVHLSPLHRDEALLCEALDRDGEGSGLREKMDLSYEIFVKLCGCVVGWRVGVWEEEGEDGDNQVMK